MEIKDYGNQIETVGRDEKRATFKNIIFKGIIRYMIMTYHKLRIPVGNFHFHLCVRYTLFNILPVQRISNWVITGPGK